MSTFCPRGHGLRQGLISALFGLGLLVLAVAPSRGSFPSVPADIELDRMGAHVETWARKVQDSCELAGLPIWFARYGDPGPGRSDFALLPSLHQAMQQIASRDHSPVRRALAALWLGNDLQEAELLVLEPLLTDERPALPLPTVQVTQEVRRCYPVSWSPPLSVAQVALRALTVTFGVRFASVEEYKTWRTKNPQPFASVDYFATRLYGRDRARAAAIFRQLDRYPAVLARVLMVRLPPALSDLTVFDLPPAQQALVFSELTPERLLRLLRRQEVWPELLTDPGLEAFAQRVFKRPEAFFPRNQAPQLLELWDKERTRAAFVHAAIAYNPSESLRIRRQTLAALGDRSPTLRRELISELARDHYAEGLPDLQGLFLTAPKPSADQPAVLAGLTAAGRPAMKTTRALLLDPRFGFKLRTPPGISPEVAEAMLDLSAALGAKIPCPERGAFRVPTALPLKSKAPPPPVPHPTQPQQAVQAAQAAQAARRVCGQRVLDWLRLAK